MTIQHHLDDATLMSLSAGTLGEALSIVAAAHTAVCQRCCSRMRQLDAIGGALLEAEAPAALDAATKSVGELAATHLRLGARQATSTSLAPSARHQVAGELPGPLARLVGKPISEIPWTWIGPGVSAHVIKLSEGAEGDLRLLRVAPNKKLPEHGHGGTELTLIVRGAYRDKFGVFGPGDIADMDEDIEHQPIVEPGEECICVVACEAPARFKGPVARLLQPLIGM